MADVEPQVVREAPVGRKQHTRRGADVAFSRAVVQRERVHRGRQLQPEKVAAQRARDARAGRKVALHQAQRVLLLARERLAQAAQVAVVAALREVVHQRELGGMAVASELDIFSRSTAPA